MKIACLSGKGGAGKTFVSVNLAAAAGKCTYIDCDVEEPNGHLFWNPQQAAKQVVTKRLPMFDAARCNGCRTCVDFCKFHALVYVKDNPMLFADVCHSCGGCALFCPNGAITEVEKPIGTIETATCGEVTVVSGVLNIGEASGVPIIRQALTMAEGVTILDCPPGSACTVMESVMDADYCLLVVEPTAFGFHNFKMVYQLVSLLGKQCGVVINKQTERYLPLEAFCKQNNLLILERFEYDPTLAQRIANGEIITQNNPQMQARFAAMLKTIGGLI